MSSQTLSSYAKRALQRRAERDREEWAKRTSRRVIALDRTRACFGLDAPLDAMRLQYVALGIGTVSEYTSSMQALIAAQARVARRDIR